MDQFQKTSDSELQKKTVGTLQSAKYGALKD
jgi:hypothetical protein